MDRRYLIATLALAATFAVCSHEMRGGKLVVLASQRLGALTGRCGASSVPGRIVSEMRARLQPGHPEEAQMLAEMNLPLMRAQAGAATLAAAQEVEAAKCARDTALHQAEMARREAQRAREDARRVRENVSVSVGPGMARSIVLHMNAWPQMDQHIQIDLAAMQQRLIAQQMKMAEASVASAMATAGLDRDYVVSASANSAGWKCAASRAVSREARTSYRNAMRNAVQSIHNSLNATSVHQGSGSSL
jgi:hypothetical protein